MDKGQTAALESNLGTEKEKAPIEEPSKEDVKVTPEPVTPDEASENTGGNMVETETLAEPSTSEGSSSEEEIPVSEEEVVDEDNGGSKKKIIILIVILVVLALGVGAFLLRDKIMAVLPIGGLQKEAKVTPAPTPVLATPTPTQATKEVDKSKYEIKILNGSGLKGEAGKVQVILEDEDFTVYSTGNASSFDFKETVIQAKRDVGKEFIDALKKALEDIYKLGDVEVLDEDSDDDVVVVVGSEKNE